MAHLVLRRLRRAERVRAPARRAAREESERLVIFASLACLIAFIALAKVFNPQYCGWRIPLAALAAPFANAAARRLPPIGFLLGQAEYRFMYGFYRFLDSTLAPTTCLVMLGKTGWLWRYVAATSRGFASAQRRANEPHSGQKAPSAACSNP